MMRSRHLIFISAAFCALTSAAFADDNLSSALKMWQPADITTNDGKVTLILPQQNITELMYQSIIKSGVCTEVYLGNSAIIKGISGIAVLNEIGKQGYIFLGGINECEKMGKLAANDADAYLMGVTRPY